METVNISVRLPKPLVTDLDQLAEQEHRDRSNMIRVLLLEAITAREPGPSPPRRSTA